MRRKVPDLCMMHIPNNTVHIPTHTLVTCSNASTPDQGKSNDVSRRVDLMAEKDDEFKPEQLETVSTMATSLHSFALGSAVTRSSPPKTDR